MMAAPTWAGRSTPDLTDFHREIVTAVAERIQPGRGAVQWEALVDQIRADNTSGAAELARTAALTVLRWIDQMASSPPSDWRAELSALASALYMAQPAMAPLFNLANTILLRLESAAPQEEVQLFVRRAVQAFLDQGAHANRRLALASLGLLPRGARILTFSYSSSVLAVLLEAHARQRLAVVFCTESRPMLEGQRMTRELTQAGIAVEFGVDAAIATFTERAHMALVGADSIAVQGIVNKLGTTSLALACRHAGVPCYVVGDRHKWFPAAAATSEISQLKPEAEVWRDPPAGVSIRNAYFECTPIELFSGIIGEDGLREPEELWRQLIDMPIAQALRGGLRGV
jgi:translation initiation factor eIF-2B subunit delta